ncbi:hypothetical protein ACFE04_023935 [Oxalis oulophora]
MGAIILGFVMFVMITRSSIEVESTSARFIPRSSSTNPAGTNFTYPNAIATVEAPSPADHVVEGSTYEAIPGADDPYYATSIEYSRGSQHICVCDYDDCQCCAPDCSICCTYF